MARPLSSDAVGEQAKAQRGSRKKGRAWMLGTPADPVPAMAQHVFDGRGRGRDGPNIHSPLVSRSSRTS